MEPIPFVADQKAVSCPNAQLPEAGRNSPLPSCLKKIYFYTQYKQAPKRACRMRLLVAETVITPVPQ